MLEVVGDVVIAPSTAVAYVFDVSDSGVGILIVRRCVKTQQLALNVGGQRRVLVSVS